MTQKASKPALSYGEMRDKLTPDDVDGKAALLHIASAERRNFAPEGRLPEYKLVLTFEEFPGDGKEVLAKEYVVNATSYKTLREKLGGDDEEAWIGQPIVMAPTTNTFNGQSFEKIHVASPERWDKAMAALKKGTGNAANGKTQANRKR